MRVVWTILLFLWALPALAVPKIQVISQENHPDIWLAEDPYLPIVSISIAFKASGYAYDPDSSLGLASLLASSLSQGTQKDDATAFQRKLEDLSSSLSFHHDADHFFITLTSLKEHLDASLTLLQEVLTSPRFAEEDLTRVKKQLVTALRRSQVKPHYLARQALKKLLYQTHPYARAHLGTEAGISSVSQEKLRSHMKEHFVRENAVVSIAGAVSQKEALALVQRYLPLPVATKKHTALPVVPVFKPGQKQHVEKDIPQSVVLFAVPAPKRNAPEFYSAYVMNHILGGGGFESMLMQEVREKNGLAYSASSMLDINMASSFLIGQMGTTTENVGSAIALTKKLMTDFKENGTEIERLTDARNYIIYSYPLRLTKNSIIAATMTTMQLFDLGSDYIEKRRAYFSSLTLDDVNSVASTLLDRSRMNIVTVGKLQ